jgi:type I restriction-modification system DNA methylase subunit
MREFEVSFNEDVEKHMKNQISQLNVAGQYIPNIFCEYFNAEEKKKSHGEVYTPKDVIDLMIFRVRTYMNFKGKDICDYASGNGAILYNIAKRYKSIKSLDGVDVQPFSTHLTFANACLANTKLHHKVRSMTFDTILERERFDKKYDLVISNPPYIGQKSNQVLFEPLKKHKFWTGFYTSKSDYLYYFIIQAIELLKPKGIACLITTQYWLTATKGNNLRKYLSANVDILEIHDFGNIKLFPNASGQENVIILMQKRTEKAVSSSYHTFLHITYDNSGAKSNFNLWSNKRKVSKVISSILSGDKVNIAYSGMVRIKKVSLTEQEINGSPWHLEKSENDIKIKAKEMLLADIVTIQPGIQTGSDKINKKNKFIKENESLLPELGYCIGDGVYVINEEEFKSLKLSRKEKTIIKPFFKVGHLNKNGVSHNSRYYLIHAEMIEDISQYPTIQKHLEKFRDILNVRFKTYALINNEKTGKWWKLVGARPDIPYGGEKIISPSRTKVPFFLYSNEEFYSSMDVFYTYSTKEENLISLKFIAAYLNSDYCIDYLKRNCKKKGIKYELYKDPISNLPFPTFNNGKSKKLKFHDVIAGNYSPIEKEGFTYCKASNTWIAVPGIYDYLLRLQYRLKLIEDKYLLKDLTLNLPGDLAKITNYDEVLFVKNALKEITDQDRRYLTECAKKIIYPDSKYKHNLLALKYFLNQVVNEILTV